MEARSQLTTEDLVLDWRTQTLHEGNEGDHKKFIRKGYTLRGKGREREEEKNYSKNILKILPVKKKKKVGVGGRVLVSHLAPTKH